MAGFSVAEFFKERTAEWKNNKDVFFSLVNKRGNPCVFISAFHPKFKDDNANVSVELIMIYDLLEEKKNPFQFNDKFDILNFPPSILLQNFNKGLAGLHCTLEDFSSLCFKKVKDRYHVSEGPAYDNTHVAESEFESPEDFLRYTYHYYKGDDRICQDDK